MRRSGRFRTSWHQRRYGSLADQLSSERTRYPALRRNFWRTPELANEMDDTGRRTRLDPCCNLGRSDCYDHQSASCAFLVLGLAAALAGCTASASIRPVSASSASSTRSSVNAERNVVYFDPGSADLRPDSRDKIRVAADEARQGGVDRIEVAGFADTVGSPSANEQLSQRRAEAVAGALEEMGVPRDEIGMSWHGETELAVRTPDNVSNPENRRVIISMASS